MPILPRRRRLTWSGYQFAQDLPQTAFEMVKLQFNAPHRVVLRHRLLPAFRRRSSLGEVASILKVTRQRVRLIEKRIILVLRRALLEGDYRRCHFCFRPAFAEPLKDLAVAVKQVDAERVITQRMWRKMVQDIWNLQPSDLGSSEQLILQILGVPSFRHLGSGPTPKPA